MPARRRLGLVQGVEPDRVVTESLSGLGLAAATLAGGLQHGNRNRDRGEGPPREIAGVAPDQVRTSTLEWLCREDGRSMDFRGRGWAFVLAGGTLCHPGRRWHVARVREIPLPGLVTSPRTYPSEWSRRRLCNPRARSSGPEGRMPRTRWDSWRVSTTPATAGGLLWARCSARLARTRWWNASLSARGRMLH